MTAPAGHQTVSVVIVSRHRPEDLRRCLLALNFQTLPAFEVVVVADPAAVQVVTQLGLGDRVKLATYDTANISQARNIGVGMAAGEVVVFLDDDAVAEPAWLSTLTGPFADLILCAAGGYVVGRNGFDLQWGAEMVGPDGETQPLEITDTTVIQGTAQRAIKTHGTNCAFRRETLVQMGGFDEAYRFYLDETDLNIRMGQRGLSAAIVPAALVQHGFAASARRRADRVPQSLFEIGASQAYFLRCHDRDLARLEGIRLQHRKTLLKHMVSGGLEPFQLAKLLSSFDEGVADGMTRSKVRASLPYDPLAPFLAFKTDAPDRSVMLYTHRRSKVLLFAQAKSRAEAGEVVTALALSRSSLFHHRWFHRDGFWVQTGGIYGKSLRSDPYFSGYTLASRAAREHQFTCAFAALY